MTDILADLATYIETQLALNPKDVGRDYLVDEGNIAIMQYPGVPANKLSISVSWNIQIVTRYASRETAREMNWNIYKLFVSFADKTNYTFLLNGRFIRASAIGPPVKSSRDSESLITYTSNILLFTSEEV